MAKQVMYELPDGDEAIERLIQAVRKILDYGVYDGGHHKQWVLDQVLRILLGDEYTPFMKAYNEELGPEGEAFDPWDTGIAP